MALSGACVKAILLQYLTFMAPQGRMTLANQHITRFIDPAINCFVAARDGKRQA
jgi:hypothetical protein